MIREKKNKMKLYNKIFGQVYLESLFRDVKTKPVVGQLVHKPFNRTLKF